MKFLFSLAILVSSLTAFSKTQLQCDELAVNKYNQHERFVILLDDSNRIEKMRDYVWDDKKNIVSGSGSAAYDVTTQTPALGYEAEEGNLIYTFQFQDEGDVDYPGPVTNVQITLSQSLIGAANVELIYDDSRQGIDSFTTNCILIK